MINNFSIVLDYCMRLVVDLQALAFNILDWFTEEVEFLGLSYTYYDLFFGTALTIFLTAALVKIFAGIVL